MNAARRRRIQGGALAVVTAGALVASCTTTKTVPVTGLEVIVTTEGLTAGTDFNDIRLEVSEQAGAMGRWTQVWNRDYVIPSQEAPSLPATFAIGSGSRPGEEALVTVTAFHTTRLAEPGGGPIVQRVAQVQVPTDRMATLWMVLAQICVGQVRVTGEGDPVSTCGAGESCQPGNGQCGSNVIADPGMLATYVPGQTLDAGVSLGLTLGDGGTPALVAEGGGSGDATVAASEDGEAMQSPDAGSEASAACNADSCPNGCCGSDGVCHNEESAAACGTAGTDCNSCTAAQTCSVGTCAPKCTPSNCPSGCCDTNGSCVTALSDSVCGSNGAQCGPCTGSNHCVNGQCGCASSSDCPAYQACQTNHSCTNACSATVTCNGGCCNTKTGLCLDTANFGANCGHCGGKVQCDGSCSVQDPSGYGSNCGHCGGVIRCDGSCSVQDPSGYGSNCGHCGGVIRCDGSCSVQDPSGYGGSCGGHCQAAGTIGCSGTCTAPDPSGYGTACGSCGGTITCAGTCSRNFGEESSPRVSYALASSSGNLVTQTITCTLPAGAQQSRYTMVSSASGGCGGTGWVSPGSSTDCSVNAQVPPFNGGCTVNIYISSCH